MSFIERVDINRVSYLLTKLSAEFVATYKTDDDNEMDYSFMKFKKILQNFEKNNGIMKITYKKSIFDTHKLFRDYTNGGVQGLPKSIRDFICKSMFDVDIVNCFPTLLLYLCKKHNIPCLYLQNYCDNRKQLIQDGMAEKMLVNKSIHTKFVLKNVSPFMISIDNEIKQIQQQLMSIDEYKLMKEMAIIKNNKNKNVEGVFMSYLLSSIESQILNHCIHYCQSKQIEIGVLMFDGFMTYQRFNLDDLTTYIFQMTNIPIQYIYKEPSTSIVMDDDFVVDDPVQIYNALKLKYETDYKLAFIVSTVSYSYKVGDVIRFYTKENLRQILRTININRVGLFVDLWIADNNRQTYNDVGVYPHDVICPDYIMNLWGGFSVEKTIYPLVDITRILNHLRILVNHDESSYRFMLKWLANMFQYPSSTSIFISLASKEGAGKSMFVDFIGSMVGKDKCSEITNMSDELFGTFNSQLRDVVLMNINEVERVDACKCFERLKSQITSPTIRIHGKGEKPYTVANLRKFISTNNNPHSITIKKGNRRYFATESSDELIGNIEYFKSFAELISQPDTQYSFWKYLMDYDTPKQLTSVDIPITKLMLESFELNADPIEDFALELECNVELFSEDIYTRYKQYMSAKGFEFSNNYKQFTMKFKRIIGNRIIREGQSSKNDENHRKRFIVLK